jgi:S1-C subfamily serine protease
MVKAVLDSAKGGSRVVRRPWLGARLQAVTPELAESLGLDRPTGVLVSSLFDKGPAEEAGIRRGDIILAVDEQAVDDPESFGYRFALKGVQGETSFTVMSGAKRRTVQVRLIPPPETRPREPVKIRSRSPFAGATAVNLSPAVADELQLDPTGEGVVIAEVDPGSVAQRVGFVKGDMVVAVNGARVVASKDLDRIVRGGANLWEITINRGGKVFTTVLGG